MVTQKRSWSVEFENLKKNTFCRTRYRMGINITSLKLQNYISCQHRKKSPTNLWWRQEFRNPHAMDLDMGTWQKDDISSCHQKKKVLQIAWKLAGTIAMPCRVDLSVQIRDCWQKSFWQNFWSAQTPDRDFIPSNHWKIRCHELVTPNFCTNSMWYSTGQTMKEPRGITNCSWQNNWSSTWEPGKKMTWARVIEKWKFSKFHENWSEWSPCCVDWICQLEIEIADKKFFGKILVCTSSWQESMMFLLLARNRVFATGISTLRNLSMWHCSCYWNFNT